MKSTTIMLLLLVSVALITCKKDLPCGCNGPNQTYVENVQASITSDGSVIDMRLSGGSSYASCNPEIAKPITDKSVVHTTVSSVSGYIKFPCQFSPTASSSTRIWTYFEITDIKR